MGLLGFIGLIFNVTSTGVSALTVASWKQPQRVGVAKKWGNCRLQWRKKVRIPA